ncbi:MAG: hypothetical protein A2W26_11285 [Acidobacteria bacterium RBG_16_64_8]|nr:MAG: hypothetical protein A2W26_11285 [Acidobacteria bacterium RBG_16_64_8]
MRPDDLDALLGIFGDPVLMAESFGAPPFGHGEMARWIERNLDHQRRHGYGLFTVVRKDTGVVIGDCGLERMDLGGDAIVELGYDIRRDCWNQGFATEAAAAVRDFPFQTLALPELTSLIRAGNLASRRVAEKIGMHLAGEILRHGHPYWRYSIDNPTARQT